MSESAADRLRSMGLDVDFLIWLEGAEDRLPQLHRLGEVDGARLAAAVRAAAWLTSQFANPDVVGPNGGEDWRKRYQLLEGFLWNSLRYSMVHHRLDRPKDLEALDEVLDILVPPPAAAAYRHDLLRLRRLGKPERLQDLFGAVKKPRRGGRRQSEQVQRMRAAIEHVRQQSKRPYRDLADLWNESLDETCYSPDQIRQALRKGDPRGPDLLLQWTRLYRGELQAAFPGEFPLIKRPGTSA